MEDLMIKLREFAEERDWNQFHSPKNLAMALGVEVAEVAEYFQWLTEEQSRKLNPEVLLKVKDEIGDVLIYLVRLADILGINPIQAAKDKIEKNKSKYPIDLVKGKSRKYSEYLNE